MGELEIKGSKQYLSYLEKHLYEEHPSTKGHTELEIEHEKKRCKTVLWTVFTGEF